MIDYFTYTKEETAETARVLELQMGTPAQYRLTQLTELIQVIRGQHEELTDNGWWEVWCVDCDRSSESFKGSIEEAAAHFLPKWAVLDLDRSQAICSECSNAPDTAHYASQYQDNSGLLG